MFKSVIVLFLVLTPSIACAQWYGTVDFMVPTRNVTDENVFQRSELVTVIPGAEVVPATDPITFEPDTILTTVETTNLLDLDFDFVAAGRATVGYRTESWGVEGSYFVTEQWNAMASVADAGGVLASPFTATGSLVNPLVDNNTFASVAYQTKLESVELNLTRLLDYPTGEGMWKVGVRALRLDEEFQYSSTNAIMANTLLSSTDNQIIGPQIGFRGQTWVPGGAIAMSLTGLLGYNDINRTSVFNGAATTTNTNEASFVGEASIEYLFAPHPNVFVRFGYQILGISGVGLAPNDPMINSNQTEGIVYSMPYAGVVVIH